MSEGVAENTWNRVLGRIENKVGKQNFNTWFKPTQFLSEDCDSVTVRVPNSWFAEWLRTNYRGVIEQVLGEVARPGLRVAFHAAPGESGAALTAPPLAASRTALPAALRPPIASGQPAPTLNPRYVFERFVVSSCNQFAHAAAIAVSEQPARIYNPLYIYGGVGLGKTHLMQAVGNLVCRRPGVRMCYISTEQFVNGLINAIRFEKTLEFKERYRNVDVLLIDDIQFLAGKERTQEEFFHTFNALYDGQKQIVITSDVPPRDLPTIEERLRSRFAWGLIADIQPPDLETKVAILRKKAEADGAYLPDDVALFIASKPTTNIRELEGALIRLMAFSSVSGRPISLELASESLRDLRTEPSAGIVTTESIQKLVADSFNLKVSQLKSKNNSRHITSPRHIAMYLCKQLTSASLPEIGRRFGKHHTTVIHGIQRIEAKRASEKDFDSLIERFIHTLK